MEIREVTSPDAVFTVYAVKIRFTEQNTWGNYVSAYLSVPKDAKAGSLVLNVNYQGAGVSDLNKRCTKGQAMLTVSAHSMELGRDSSYYTTPRGIRSTSAKWFCGTFRRCGL